MNTEPSEYLTPPGAFLRSLRQEMGWSVLDVAKQLRLKEAIINAIENDDYEAITERVFLQGYLRGYANLLRVDPEEMMGALNHYCPHVETQLKSSAMISQTASHTSSREKYVWWGSFSIVAIFVLLGFLKWHSLQSFTNNFVEPSATVSPDTTSHV